MKNTIALNNVNRTNTTRTDVKPGIDILHKATIALLNDDSVESSFEELYICLSSSLSQPSFARNLCQSLEYLIDCHTRSIFDQFRHTDYESLHFLRKMNDCWKNHCRQFNMIRGAFSLLDRKFILKDTSTLSTWDLGIERFRHYFSSNAAIQNRTVTEILNLIEQERRNLVIERTIVRDLLSMMTSLSIYKTVFEPRFLEETQKLYKAESYRLMSELEVPDYLKYVDKIIQDEKERSYLYLEPLTQAPLIHTVETELIAAHQSALLTKGLDKMLDGSRTKDLIRLHSLLSRVPNGLNELCTHFNKHIKDRGSVIVTDPNKDKTMVQELLDFKKSMDDVVNACFNKQEKFVNSLKEAFEHFINQRPNKPAEMIAKYVDSKLKSGHRQVSEDELEAILDQILVLFRFIHGKDVFEAFYKKYLAKRLLVNKSASVDAEKSMLSKLKQECGAAFTSKLEGMFRDIEASRDTMKNFKNYMANRKVRSPIDMTLNVLTMGFWPTYEPMDVILPKFLQEHQNAFETFYTSKQVGRKLQWQPNLGQCTLVAQFPNSQQTSGRHELAVSLYQALVLLLFNEKDEYNFKEIQEATKIDTVELNRTLQSLSCGRWRVLLKAPRSRDVGENDKFAFNTRFTSNLFKIKINKVQLKETQEEQAMTEEKVFADRQHHIDAAIVRIMKTRKKLSHSALVSELSGQLRFPVKSHDVKARIEVLIERDYIGRQQLDPSQYHYVA